MLQNPQKTAWLFVATLTLCTVVSAQEPLALVEPPHIGEATLVELDVYAVRSLVNSNDQDIMKAAAVVTQAAASTQIERKWSQLFRKHKYLFQRACIDYHRSNADLQRVTDQQVLKATTMYHEFWLAQNILASIERTKTDLSEARHHAHAHHQNGRAGTSMTSTIDNAIAEIEQLKRKLLSSAFSSRESIAASINIPSDFVLVRSDSAQYSYDIAELILAIEGANPELQAMSYGIQSSNTYICSLNDKCFVLDKDQHSAKLCKAQARKNESILAFQGALLRIKAEARSLHHDIQSCDSQIADMSSTVIPANNAIVTRLMETYENNPSAFRELLNAIYRADRNRRELAKANYDREVSIAKVEGLISTISIPKIQQ